MAQIKVPCPLCPRRGKSPDKKRHLSINTEKNLAHCFRCGGSSRNAERLVSFYNIRLPQGVTFGSIFADAINAPEVELPEGYTGDISAYPDAYAYLKRRGLSDALIYGYEIGYCPSGPYRQRVVLPVYYNGALKFWQARDITNASPLKYTSPEIEKTCLFNIHRAVKHDCVVLVEGMFDALRIPNYGVALLGKELTTAQRSLLLRHKPSVVLVSLDADAQEFAQQIQESLLRLLPVVELYPVPRGVKDWGDASSKSIQELEHVCEFAGIIFGQ